MAIGTLLVFGKDWTIQPSRDWIMSAVKAVGRNTAESSNEVTRRFIHSWSAGTRTEFVPLASDEAWGNNRDRHHVPVLRVNPFLF